MKIAKSSIYSIFLAIVFVIGVFYVFRNFTAALNFKNLFYNYTNISDSKLYPQEPITQLFTASENNLSAIKLAFNDIDEMRFGEKILMEISEPDCSHIIRSSEYSALISPISYIYTHFQFNTIEDSKNKQYCLKITYLANEKRSKRPRVKTSRSEIFSDVSFANEGREKIYTGESLVIQPAYSRGSTWQNLKELNNLLSQYKPNFYKENFLTAIVAIFLTGTFLLAYLIIKIK